MIVLGPSLNPIRQPDITGDNPIVCINNLVTIGNISADFELATNPATNLANSATSLKWNSGAKGAAQNVTVDTTGHDAIDFLAVAGHNFGDAAASVNAQGWQGDYVLGSNMRAINLPLLTEALGVITSESGTPLLNETTTARIGNMTSGGGLAAAFDNTTNQAAAACAEKTATTSAYVGTDFSATAAGKRCFQGIVFGSNNTGFSTLGAGTSITINLRGKPVGLGAPANAADGTLLGTTTFSNTTNESAGRTITSSDQATLFDYLWFEVLGTSATLAVAEAQFFESLENWFDLTTAVTPTDNLPMIFKFVSQPTLQKIRLKIGAGTLAAPQAAVLYTGQSLVFQRRVYVGHTPMSMGRVTNVVTGMSENANYLGRIVLGESRKTSVNLRNLSPAWYRANMEPFIDQAVTTPFFFAWRPYSYPNETGFTWLASDAVPVNQLANGMMSVQLSLAGVAS